MSGALLLTVFSVTTIFNEKKNGKSFFSNNVQSLLPIEKLWGFEATILKESSENTSYKHITIYYSELNNSLLEITYEALEEGMTRNSIYLGSYSKPHDFMIFNTVKAIEDFSGASALNGFHLPLLNLSGVLIPQDKEALENLAPPVIWEYRKNIMHEYSHYVFEEKIKELEINSEEIPYWFIEGYAEYIGYQGMENPFIFKKPVPLDELTTADQWKKYNNIDSQHIYMQSYLAVNFLMVNYGDSIVLEILNEMKSTKDFSDAFENVIGIKIEELNYYEESYLK